MSFKEIFLKIKLNFSIVYVLIGVNLMFYLISFTLSQVYDPIFVLHLLGAEYLTDIFRGQIWRFVTPSFLHAGFFHLILNMWALFHLGGAIETFYGQKKLLIVYVLTGICGSIFSIMFGWGCLYLSEIRLILLPICPANIGSGFPLSVGSSAAVFGFVGLMIGNKFKKNTYSVSIDNYINTSQLWFFVAINILFGLGINGFGGGFAINNLAHIGGFLGGFLLGLFLDLINTTFQTRQKRVIESMLYLITVLILVLSFSAQLLYIMFAVYAF